MFLTVSSMAWLGRCFSLLERTSVSESLFMGYGVSGLFYSSDVVLPLDLSLSMICFVYESNSSFFSSAELSSNTSTSKRFSGLLCGLFVEACLIIMSGSSIFSLKSNLD